MAPPNRRSLLDKLKEIEATAQDVGPKESDFWADLYRRIYQHQLVPILGSAVRQNRIFDFNWDSTLDSAGADNSPAGETPSDEELADAWSEELKYPLLDRKLMARVAQYNRVISADPDQAQTKYLLFLKKTLLTLAQNDATVAHLVPGLRANLINTSFADIVAGLDYPRFTDAGADPLRVLAKLRLPIYVTTSHYDFMERALRAEGVDPDKLRTHFCLWNMEETRVDPKHRPDPLYVPSVEAPVVYHLFGYEGYPRSMVLSEDDFLDFLLAFVQDSNTNKPLIPLYLRSALEESSLLLLGYRLHDWDFRILFRWLTNFVQRRLSAAQRMYGVAIHLDPQHQPAFTNVEDARTYLKRYFGSANFQVEWGGIDRFIATLWQEWNQRRQGQP